MIFSKRSWPLLGTFVEVTSPLEATSTIYSDLFQKLKNLELLFNVHDKNSFMTKVNISQSIEVYDPDFINVLNYSIDLYKTSHGRFNFMCLGELIKKNIVPDYTYPILKTLGTLDDIHFDGKLLSLKNIGLCFDGIAKGYIVDCAIAFLKDKNVTSACVNAGGDLKIYGDFQYPIYKRMSNDKLDHIGSFSNCAIATSNAENKTKDRTKYSGHIIQTGHNFENEVFSIKAENAWLADALTKVAANTDKKNCHTLIKKLGGEVI